MNEGYYKDNGPCCYFHPKEVLVGVCPLCLTERLVVLAAKQGLHQSSSKSSSSYSSKNCSKTNNLYKTKSSSSSKLPKIFALGSFLNRRNNVRQRRSRKSGHHDDDLVDFANDPDTTSTSLEDESFISIKFGDNGVASWDKNTTTVSKVTLDHCSMPWGSQSLVKDASSMGSFGSNNKSMVEHTKPRAALRWRKRIGQILQVIRWRRVSQANSDSKGDGVKMVRNDKGWMRTLKIRTKE